MSATSAKVCSENKIPKMATSSSAVLYVTCIEKHGPFIKVWGQTDRSLPLLIEKSLLHMIPQFDQGRFIPPIENIQTGNILYCAKYVDGSYYRARVINVTLIQQNFVEVHFVDFGNRELVPVMNLRMISSFSPALITVPAQAKDFVLANVTHQGASWDPTTISLISNEIRYSELTYLVVSQVGNANLIKLFRNGEDFALSLFNRGVVLSIAMNAQHMILQSIGASSSLLPQVQQQISPPVSVSPLPVLTPSVQASTPALLTYKGALIEPGAEYHIYVSYVCDGPCQFSIQLKKYEDNLARLMKELNTMTLQPFEDFAMPGTVCAARCIEDDHVCRAVVTNIENGKYKVFYVDFGNTEFVPIENLFQIPFKYVIPKVMATRYALAGLNPASVTVEMKCAFKEFVSEKLLRMQALAPPARSALPLCNLFDENNVNVLDVLQRVSLLAYPNAIQLSRGFSQEIHVSYVHSCSRFYVQIEEKKDELANLMTSLQQVCTNGQPLQTIKVGLPCCSLFEDDGQWYRAQVIHMEGANVRVRYVDFGNEAVVAIDQLIKPPGEVITVLRPQAIECCLNGYQNMEDDLERDNILEQLILEQDFTMKVIEMQNNRALVDLINLTRYNVGSLLLEQLAASKSQVGPILIQENHQIQQRNKRTIDESTNLNRNERKPLRDQNDRGFEKQDSWRQSKPLRKEDDFDKTSKPSNEPSWRDNSDGANKRQDSFNKPRRDNFDKPYEKRDGNKDSWDGNGNSNWKSNQKREEDFGKPNRGNSESSWRDNREKLDTNDNDKPQRDNLKPRRDNFEKREGFKKDSWQSDSNSNWKSNKTDESKTDTWGDDKSSKPKNKNPYRKKWDDGGWDNSDKDQRQTNRFNKFENDRKPRHQKSFSANTNDSWGSSDATNQTAVVNRVTDPAPFTSVFSRPDVLNRNEKVIISWFHEPAHFFCQLFDVQAEFKTMMDDIQNHYCNIKPDSAPPVGAPVVALFPSDGVMYRACILEATGSQFRVQYIDYGNISTTNKVWPIENKFMKLKAQAIHCGLNYLIPVGEAWPDAKEFSSYFGKEHYYCQFVSCDDNNCFAVELTSEGAVSLSDSLITGGLAQYQLEQEPYDPSILLGQQIKVIVKDVNAIDVFYIELPNYVVLPCTLHNLISAIETFEDVLKQLTEQFVLMYVDNVFDDKLEVTLYDTTGVKHKILEPDEGAFETIDIPCQLPVLYSTISGWVSHVQATEAGIFNIFIQPAEHTDTLAQLLDSLFNHYHATEPEESLQPEIEHIYAVHSSDANWYRGQITSIQDKSVVVTLIDYGNSETVDVAEIRNLASEFCDQHILALQVVSVTGAGKSIVEQNVTATVWYGENGWEGEVEIQAAEEQIETVSQPNLTESEVPVDSNPEAVSDNVLVQESEVAQVGVPVILSHADSPSEFYLQQSDSIETIENLQATLQEQILDFPVLETPTAGALCAAPYSVDQQWHRAQVLDADDDITTVRFVDFGNTDVISNATTSVKTLPPELLSLEQYARRTSLMIEPIGPEWSPAAFERFEQLTGVEDLTAEIIHQDEKTTFVKLLANGLDVGEELIEEGLANKLQLEIESSCTGYVSNLNSPSEFWIQLENSVVELEWIVEQLSSAASFPELKDFTPGSLCAALFPDDEMWYRGRILSNTVAGLEILFIDYGNSCTCISLRQLCEDLIMLPALAQKCSLEKPMGILQWGQQSNDEFKAISADGATVFNIDKVSTGETYIVRLLLNNENISEKLLPITEDLHISHFESISSFWIQKALDMARLNSISEKLTDAGNWTQYEDKTESCELVAALYIDDETWYRARIVGKNDTSYEVFFIDYGNTGLANDIRTLSSDIDKEHQVAIHCKLEPLPGFRWSEESSSQLAEINNEGSTLFQAEFIGGDVVRLYLDGGDIRLKLESIPISSVQNSPRKSIPVKPFTDLTHLKDDTPEIIDVAEIYHAEVEDSKLSREELSARTDDIFNDPNDSKEIAVSIVSDIQNSVNEEIDSRIINSDIFDQKELNEFVDDTEEIVQDILCTITNAVSNDQTADYYAVNNNYENGKTHDDSNGAYKQVTENYNIQLQNEALQELNNKETIFNLQNASKDDNSGSLKDNLSNLHSEKIVPGSICRGDLDVNTMNTSGDAEDTEFQVEALKEEISRTTEKINNMESLPSCNSYSEVNDETSKIGLIAVDSKPSIEKRSKPKTQCKSELNDYI